MGVYSIYKYYKGGIHKVITTGINTEKGESMVVHEDEQRQILITPSEVFNGFIKIGEREIERYEYMGNIN